MVQFGGKPPAELSLLRRRRIAQVPMSENYVPSWFVLSLRFYEEAAPVDIWGFVKLEGPQNEHGDRDELVVQLVQQYALDSERARRGVFTGKLKWTREPVLVCYPQPQLERKVAPVHNKDGVTVWLTRSETLEG